LLASDRRNLCETACPTKKPAWPTSRLRSGQKEHGRAALKWCLLSGWAGRGRQQLVSRKGAKHAKSCKNILFGVGGLRNYRVNYRGSSQNVRVCLCALCAFARNSSGGVARGGRIVGWVEDEQARFARGRQGVQVAQDFLLCDRLGNGTPRGLLQDPSLSLTHVRTIAAAMLGVVRDHEHLNPAQGLTMQTIRIRYALGLESRMERWGPIRPRFESRLEGGGQETEQLLLELLFALN